MQFISQEKFNSIHPDYKSDTHITIQEKGATVSVPYTILPGSYVNSSAGQLCGNDIFIVVSFDKKNDWINGYIENSNYVRIRLEEDNTIEQFVTCLYKKNQRNSFEGRLDIKLRKSKNKTREQAIEKIKKYLSQVQDYYDGAI